MAPKPYLLHVQSHPIRVTLSTWEQWYTEEHARDMVHFGASSTAAFYRSTSEIARLPERGGGSAKGLASHPDPEGNDHKAFLCLYQSETERCLDFEGYKRHVRVKSALWDGGSSCHDVGAFSPTYLEVSEVLGKQGGEAGR
jgi:hypothetical protein